MITVSLTMGYFAFVDDHDFSVVDGYNWQAYVDKHSPTHTVYAYRRGPRPKRGRIWMHRVLLDAPDGVRVDHRDGNGLNNQRLNIRLATNPQNVQNSARRSDNSSGFKGVTFHPRVKGKQWQAQIQVDGIKKYLGIYATAEQAAHSYDTAALKYFGDFARFNFPPLAA